MRGEVLDIFLPCEENPTRFVFDFDQIESIKYFDVENQMTLESRDFVLVHPMKEILWTDDLVSKLSEKLDEYQATSIKAESEMEGEHVHLPFTDKANPEVIKRELGLSKNAFKRAVGRLYKERKIVIEEKNINYALKYMMNMIISLMKYHARSQVLEELKHCRLCM